jgi:hypothetical protein
MRSTTTTFTINFSQPNKLTKKTVKNTSTNSGSSNGKQQRLQNQVNRPNKVRGERYRGL